MPGARSRKAATRGRKKRGQGGIGAMEGTTVPAVENAVMVGGMPSMDKGG